MYVLVQSDIKYLLRCQQEKMLLALHGCTVFQFTPILNWRKRVGLTWDPKSLKNNDFDSSTHLWSELDNRCAHDEIHLTGDYCTVLGWLMALSAASRRQSSPGWLQYEHGEHTVLPTIWSSQTLRRGILWFWWFFENTCWSTRIHSVCFLRPH